MKIWQIKAMSLRIMFADTGIQFSEEDFRNGVVYSNGNTREYLVRMEDSIRRAIDKYYEIVGQAVKRKRFTYVEEDGVLQNRIDLSTEDTMGFPTRIDVEIYDEETGDLVKKVTEKEFVYDSIDQSVEFDNFDYTDWDYDIKFVVWYKTKKFNLPEDRDELTYDLDEIHLPQEVQRMIPYFVKGELFEEDEPNLAEQSKSSYFKFLYGLRKGFSNVQKKVKRANVFAKTN